MFWHALSFFFQIIYLAVLGLSFIMQGLLLG